LCVFISVILTSNRPEIICSRQVEPQLSFMRYDADCRTVINDFTASATAQLRQIDSSRKRVKTIELYRACKRVCGGHSLQSIPPLINSFRGQKSAAGHPVRYASGGSLWKRRRSRPVQPAL